MGKRVEEHDADRRIKSKRRRVRKNQDIRRRRNTANIINETAN